MGLFNRMSRIATNSAAIYNDVSTVKNTRKAIFEIRDRLRGTPLFSQMFYQIVVDPYHPPCKIEATQTGQFWSQAWTASMGNYEPYTTQKLDDHNLGYAEGCAIYLLIQECYPNVYDFPSNTTTALANGATIKLNMKKQFVGKALKPATLPAPANAAPVQQPVYATPAQPAYEAPAPAQTAAKFCTNCGNKLQPGAKFCSGCGTKLG